MFSKEEKPVTEEELKEYKRQFDEFEDVKEEGFNNKDSAAKNISLMLIETQSTDQVMTIFENEYLRKP